MVAHLTLAPSQLDFSTTSRCPQCHYTSASALTWGKMAQCSHMIVDTGIAACQVKEDRTQ